MIFNVAQFSLLHGWRNYVKQLLVKRMEFTPSITTDHAVSNNIMCQIVSAVSLASLGCLILQYGSLIYATLQFRILR